jgi:hypothetical protein
LRFLGELLVALCFEVWHDRLDDLYESFLRERPVRRCLGVPRRWSARMSSRPSPRTP